MKTLKRIFTCSVLAICFSLCAVPSTLAQENVQRTVVKIGVEAQAQPSALEMFRDGTLQPVPLSMVKAAPLTYGVELANPFLTANQNTLTFPYVVTASWGAKSEEIFLELRRAETKEISADILDIPSSGTGKEIKDIEGLSKVTYRAQIRRYFWARAHHKFWRQTQQNVTHQSAIRSIKEWFDASYWLASREQTYFRMDPHVLEYLEEYRKLAVANPGFGKKLEMTIKPGYIDGMLKEVKTTRFQQAAAISGLVERGDLDAAIDLNNALLVDLEKLPTAEQKELRVTRGVTLDQFKKNAAFLNNRAGRM